MGCAAYPALFTARNTASTSVGAPGCQRTAARFVSRSTAALATPGTLWTASVTRRAQLPQFIPLTFNSARAAAVDPVLSVAVSLVSICLEKRCRPKSIRSALERQAFLSRVLEHRSDRCAVAPAPTLHRCNFHRSPLDFHRARL